MESAIANGFDVEAYAWITSPFSPLAIANVLNEINGLPITRLWLDAEDEKASNQTASQNVSDIRSAINLVKLARPDLETGIYTGAGWWRANTGDNSDRDIASHPLWFANYRSPDGVADYRTLLFGGWSSAAMWQYADTVDTAGLNTDRNLILEDTVVDTYTRAEIDAKVGALLGLEVDLGGQIHAIAAAFFAHVQNHASTAVSESEAQIKEMLDELAQKQAELADRIERAGAILNGG